MKDQEKAEELFASEPGNIGPSVMTWEAYGVDHLEYQYILDN